MEASSRKVSIANGILVDNENNEALQYCLQTQASTFRVDLMITLSVDMAINGGLDSDAGDDNTESEPDADEVFTAAAQGLLEGLMAAIQLSSCSLHANHDDGGILQFSLDLEALARDKDKHGAVLSTKRKKESASKAMAHMGKHAAGNSRSPSRASSRAASRFGGSTTASALAMRHSMIAMKLAKLSLHPSSLSKPSDPFHIVSWDEVANNSSEVDSQTSSHATISAPRDRKIAEDTTTYSTRGQLNTASTNITSRVPFDFHEAQRRDEISSDIDNRETRRRIARDVRRKGDFKLKLRSLTDPTVSVESEEALASLAKRGSSRGGFRLDSRGGSVISMPIAGTRLQNAAKLVIPENMTFRQEDYDGLQSDVVMLDRNGELLVGENCFLVTKKPRQELLSDLLRKSTIEPRVQLSSSLQEMSLDGGDPTDANSAAPVERQPSRMSPERSSISRMSPNRPSVSRNSPGRRISSIAVQDALFDGQRGSFETFPRLELDPEKTPLTKGVTLKVDEAVKRDAAVALQAPPLLAKAKLTKPTTHTAVSGIQETRPNDPLENQLKALMLQSRHKGLHRKSSFHQLTSRLDTFESAHEASSPEHSRLSEHRPLSKHHNQQASQKDIQNHARTRTPAVRERISRKALLKPEFPNFGDDDLELDYLYSLHESGEPTSLPKVKPYQREFPSPPRGHIKVMSAAKASELVSSPRSLPFPFPTLPAVLKGNR